MKKLSGRPFASVTTCSALFGAAAQPPAIPLLPAGSMSYGAPSGGLRRSSPPSAQCPPGGQSFHHAQDDTHLAPPLVELRAIVLRRIISARTVAIDEKYVAQNPLVIDTWPAAAFRKTWLKPSHLFVRQPVQVAHA